MASISKKYISIGVRRDKNLGDVQNSRTALNNLLNNLVNDPTETFISEDLDAIRGIKNTNVTAEKISGIAGITVTYSDIDVGPNKFAVTDISSDGAAQSTITVTTSSAHSLFSGDIVAVKNAAVAAANGKFSVVVTSTTTFTYQVSTRISQSLFLYPVSILSDGNRPFSTITVTMSAAHNLTTGDDIVISESAFPQSNGEFTVTVANSTQFTFIAKGYVEADLEGVLEDTTFTSIDTGVFNTVIENFEVKPLVTIRDRIQAAKTFTGDPPAISGGLGPVTRFIPSIFIKEGTQGSTGNSWAASGLQYKAWANAFFTVGDIPGNLAEFGTARNTRAEALADISSVIDALKYTISTYQDVGEVTYDLTTGVHTFEPNGIFELTKTQVQEVFWSNGYFNFPAIIDRSFEDQYGGVQWEGYFSPQPYDNNVVISFNTTGLILFELDRKDDGNWETLKSFYAGTRSVSAVSGSGTNTITLAAGQVKFVGVGDIIGNDPNTTTPITITDISGNDLVLSDTYTLPVANTLTVTKKIGETITYGSVSLPSVEVGDMIKIRISLWYPDNGLEIYKKSVDFSYIGTDLNFNYLYSVKTSATPAPNEIRTFLKNAVSPAQTKVGDYLNNKNFYVGNSFSAAYSPVSSLSAILRQGPLTATFQANNRVFTTSTSMTTVDVGNYIVPTVASTSTAIKYPIQVWNSIGATTKVISKALDSSFAESVNFIENKGLISWFYASSSGTTVTLTGPFTSIFALTYGVSTTISTGANKHYLSPGDRVSITGAAINDLNTSWKVLTVSNDYTFTIGYNSSSVSTPYTANSARLTVFNNYRLRPGNVVIYKNDNVVSSITKGATTTITSNNHGFGAGAVITISGATGFTSINGTWTIQTVATNSFTINLNSSALSGTYTSNSAKVNDYVRIAAVDNLTPLTFTTNVPLNLTGEEIIYVYADRGLIDYSKDVFCKGVFGQVLNVTASLGSTILTLRSVEGIAVNQVVQFGTSLANNTTVQSVDTNNKTVTISAATLATINASSTIVFSPAGTTLNKEGCVIPLDTAPPFVGTLSGLSTGSKGINSASANSTFKVVTNKIVTTIPTNNVESVSGVSQFNRKVTIKKGSTIYSILGRA